MMDYSPYPRNDVLCIDMRSFYASVEAIKLGLDPMTTLLAVVGDPNRSGSIVLAASPTLKKSIVSAMSAATLNYRKIQIFILFLHIWQIISMFLLKSQN